MAGSQLYTTAALIRDSFDELQTAWLDAAEHWNDGVSRRFCEIHLEPAGPVVKLALDAISRMSHIIDHMHRDCDQ
jgi:hypothetical protein